MGAANPRGLVKVRVASIISARTRRAGGCHDDRAGGDHRCRLLVVGALLFGVPARLDRITSFRKNPFGCLAYGFGMLLAVAGIVTLVLIAPNVGDPEEGDPREAGERPPSGFECE